MPSATVSQKRKTAAPPVDSTGSTQIASSSASGSGLPQRAAKRARHAPTEQGGVGGSNNSIVTFLYPRGQAKAPIKDHTVSAVDPESGEMFWYGGQNSEDLQFGNELFVLNVNSKTWKNLNNATSTAPRSNATHKLTSLPTLAYPSFTFVRLSDGRRVLLLFGGYDCTPADPNDDDDEDPDAELQITNDLFEIDLQSKSWRKIPLGNTTAPKRRNAAIAFVENQNRLYIFGGAATDPTESDDALASYSVILYDPLSKSWRWETAEVEFPAHVPRMGYNPRATVLFDGAKILLTPGRLHIESYINISKMDLIYFTTSTGGFSAGEAALPDLPFPRAKIVEYQVIPFLRPPSTPTAWKPFVLFCCWMLDPPTWKYFDDDSVNHLVEVYRYPLPVNDTRITSLRQVKKIANLFGLCPQGFFTTYRPRSDNPTHLIPDLFVMGNKIIDNTRDTGTRTMPDVDVETICASLLQDPEDISPERKVVQGWANPFIENTTQSQPTFDKYAEIPLEL